MTLYEVDMSSVGSVADQAAEHARRERFTAIYQANYHRLLGYALRRTSEDAAADIVAEVFLVVLETPRARSRRRRGASLALRDGPARRRESGARTTPAGAGRWSRAA
jgi:hypothetical protein